MSILYKAFINGKIYNTYSRSFCNKALVVNDGIIVDATLCDIFSGACEIVDLNNTYVIPGLIDIHTHGRAGFDFTTVTSNNEVVRDNLSSMLKSYARAGTTSVMATLASATKSLYEACIDIINEKRKNRLEGEANIIGFHLEGRYINPKKRGAHALALLPGTADPDEIEEFIMRMRPLPTHISTAPEIENGEKFIKRSVSLGATVSIAHSDATYDEAVRAVSWGATSFTHLYNAMREIHHRDPGNSVAALLLDSIFVELICDGFHISPPMIALAERVKPRDKIVLITDSMEAAGSTEASGCGDGNYNLAGSNVTVKAGRAINDEGAIAGSTLDLFDGMCNFAKFCEISIEEAIPAATINPSKLVFGGDPPVGSLDAGKRADFITMDSTVNPKIKDVYIGGIRVQ